MDLLPLASTLPSTHALPTPKLVGQTMPTMYVARFSLND